MNNHMDKIPDTQKTAHRAEKRHPKNETFVLIDDKYHEMRQMDRIDCPKCFLDHHGWKVAMWQVPLGEDRWLHRCAICTLMFATDGGVSSEDAARVFAGNSWDYHGIKSIGLSPKIDTE